MSEQNSTINLNNKIKELKQNNNIKLGVSIVFSLLLIVAILILYFVIIRPDKDLINNLTKQVEDCKNSETIIKNLKAEIEEKKNEIAKLNGKINSLNNSLNNSTRTTSKSTTSNSNDVEKLNNDLKELNNDLIELNKKYEDKVKELDNSLREKDAILKTYQDLSDAINPLINEINDDNTVIGNDTAKMNEIKKLNKIRKLTEILTSIKNKMLTSNLTYNLNELNTIINNNFDKLSSIKNQLELNSINAINEKSISDWFNSKIPSLTVDQQSNVLLSELRTLIGSGNLNSVQIKTVISNIINKINNNTNFTPTTDIETKANQIVNNLNLYKPFYELGNSVPLTTPASQATEYKTNYIVPTTINSDDAKKTYIENSIKFLEYAINKLQTQDLSILKQKIDSISSLQSQVTNLQSQLDKYTNSHITSDYVPIDKLRNVVLTGKFDVGQNASQNEMLMFNNKPFFMLGACADGPSICGVQLSDRNINAAGQESKHGNVLYKRKTGGGAKLMDISYKDTYPQRFILLNHPEEIDWIGLNEERKDQGEYYDKINKPNHVKSKILKNAILTNTSLKTSPSGIRTVEPFPDCLKFLGTEYDVALIGQYGPDYDATGKNIGPWCSLYKKAATDAKISLTPFSSNMVYINNPENVDFSEL